MTTKAFNGILNIWITKDSGIPLFQKTYEVNSLITRGNLPNLQIDMVLSGFIGVLTALTKEAFNDSLEALIYKKTIIIFCTYKKITFILSAKKRFDKNKNLDQVIEYYRQKMIAIASKFCNVFDLNDLMDNYKLLNHFDSFEIYLDEIIIAEPLIV